MAKKKRSTEIFSLSFMDCICCGFGAVILIFVITTGRGLKVQEDILAAASSQIVALENLTAEVDLSIMGLLASLISAKEQKISASKNQDEASKLEQELKGKQTELAELEQKTAVLQAELDSYVEVEPEVPVEQTQPQYLTEFSLDGQRILLLVEASGGMLGNNVDEAISILQLPPEQRLASEKWKTVREAVKTLLFYLPMEAEYQVVLFANEVLPMAPSQSASDWLKVADGNARAKVFRVLDDYQPSGGANYERAFKYARNAQADNIVLLTDGLPTKSDTYASPEKVTETHRLVMLKGAKQLLPPKVPINILLFPMAGDPGATAHLWRLAYDSGGSLITPSVFWPK